MGMRILIIILHLLNGAATIFVLKDVSSTIKMKHIHQANMYANTNHIHEYLHIFCE